MASTLILNRGSALFFDFFFLLGGAFFVRSVAFFFGCFFGLFFLLGVSPPAGPKGPWPVPLDSWAFWVVRALKQMPAVAAFSWVRGCLLLEEVGAGSA